MDASDPFISFDDEGVCNHCRQYEALVARWQETAPSLDAVIAGIREAGRGRDFDCLLGLSGGVDSSFMAYQARLLGLRPLAIHLDNGWDTELAIQNIQNIVTKLDIDLITHVVDWDEFRDLQVAFLKASVVDVEMVTDHAIAALSYRQARKHDIPFLLSGTNLATEAVLPRSWVHTKTDRRHLRAIHRRYGTGRLRTFPTISTLEITLLKSAGRLKVVELLDHLDYRHEGAIETLRDELGWRPYGGKHHESFFTRFFQAYILPRKFGIDKRRAHLSSLICSGQMDRAKALEELSRPIVDEVTLAADKEYVVKKLRLTESEFDELMRRPPRAHDGFASEASYLRVLSRAKRVLRPSSGS
jgi:N-acetyl sugar amidotransferase